MKYIKEKGKRYMALLMVCVMMVGLFPGGVYADVVTGLQTSVGTTGYIKNGDPVVIDRDLRIEGIDGNISEVRVMIRNLKDGDKLNYSTVHGITGNYNATTGILSLSGVTTALNYETALRSVTFSTTSPNTQKRTIDFVLGSGLYFEGTGHFYEYVSTGSAISWQAAKNAAENSSFYGRQGYLVTITSAAENAFVRSKTLGLGWIGAQDIDHPNGDWRWVTGPEGLLEDGGYKFWSGYNSSAGQGKTPNESYNDRYNNWQSGEPNNWSRIEYVAHIFGLGNSHGEWNDFSPTDNTVRGYIVEYGSMPGDSLINIQASKDIVISDIPVFSVIYNSDGHTDGTVPTDDTGYTAGNTVTVLGNTGSLIKTGYTFNGWNTAENGTGTSYSSGDTLAMGSSDVILYAQYSVNQYIVTFKSNGGSVIGPITADFDSLITEPIAPTKADYDFAGWYKESGLSTAWNFGSDTVPTEDITLYGKWTIKEYTVTFKDHDGTELKEETVEQGSEASAPTSPTRTGYTFTGWDRDFIEVTANLTVTATYSINNYKLTINYTMSDESSAPDSYTATLNFNKTYSVISPSVDGYTPDVDTVSGTTGASDKTVEVTYSANIDTAYKVEHYQENLEGEYVKIDTDNLTGTTNTTATASAKTYTGFSENTTHFDRVASGKINGDSSTVLKLYYDRDEYTVTFKDQDGTVLDTQLVNYQNNASSPANPTRSGYTFRGWYEDEALTNAFDFDTLIVEDIILYARWSRISSGGGSTPSIPSTSQQQELGNTIVTVNGVSVSAGTETKITEDRKSTTLVQVNNEIIESKINEAIKSNTTGGDNIVQIPVADKNSEVIKVELTGDIIKKLEENAFTISVKNNDIEYIIPAEEFTISKVAETLNILVKDLKEIKVEVRITKLDEKTVETYNEVAKSNGAELVFPPVAFEVVAKTTKIDGTTGEFKISKFSNYVERVMEIPAGVDPSKITTGIVFNPDGTYSHVPTSVFQKDGKRYARINSLTNSSYSAIWNPITVESVEKHWSKEAVNDMASRLVIKNPERFMPNQNITRGEFAEYITKALGIYRTGATNTQKFSDVEVAHELANAIEIASEYGIISGYPDGSFKPDAQISREEAMAMYSRAMDITGFEEVDSERINNYTDKDLVAGWAFNDVKKTVSAGVFNGKTKETINPKDTFTCAEATTAIRNLLVASGLINE